MSNNSRPLPGNNTRVNSVTYLIVTGLGYCCPNAFWKLYGHLPAPLIAARLGVRDDTVRRNKQWWREGAFPCAGKGNCMKDLGVSKMKYCCEPLEQAEKVDMLIIEQGEVTWFIGKQDAKGQQRTASTTFCPFCGRPLSLEWSTAK